MKMFQIDFLSSAFSVSSPLPFLSLTHSLVRGMENGEIIEFYVAIKLWVSISFFARHFVLIWFWQIESQVRDYKLEYEFLFLFK
jgi:hypothetical protein